MKIVPRTLSGFKDRLPKEAIAKNTLLSKVSNVFLSFGFMPIETPHLEYAEILTKQGSDEIQKELYAFKDHGGREVALRFDLTLPLARFISQYKNEVDLPFKRYAIGNVFRGERAQKGRYREFTQCDFDFIGSDSVSCDAEIIQVIYKSMIELGIEEFCVWINHREILNGILKHCGFEDVAPTLRIIDKLDKIGADGIKAEIEKEHIKGDVDALLKYISIKQHSTWEEFHKEIEPMKSWNQSLEKGINDLEKMFEILKHLDMDRDSYRVNFSIARGLGYYTGIVYETTLNRLKSIGSVCSGGRYDNLTRTFSDEKMSGVGASIGIDRLLAALEELELLNPKSTRARALIVCMEESYLGYAHFLANSFRQSGIGVEVYPEIKKLKKQFDYANTKGHEFVIVIGENEFKTKSMTLKNMTSGLQLDEISLLKALRIISEQ